MSKLPLLPILALTAAVSCSAVRAADFETFKPLIGQWDCRGNFYDGRPIASTLSAQWDDTTGTLIVHHDDLPPFGYHATEIWGPTTTPESLHASIADAFNGVRWYSSVGWIEDTLTWARSENGRQVERFAYVRAGQTKLIVTWSLSRDGSTFKVGDTLECTRR